jgi:hypothetical protein
MNAYFLTLTNEEREAIKNQHKEIYDGFTTQYAQNNEQPLYIEDFAKDKGGITVNNKGEVSEYKNVAINEMRFDNKDTGLFSDEAEKTAKSDIKKHFNKSAKRPFHYEEDPSEDWPKHAIDYDTEFDIELDEDFYAGADYDPEVTFEQVPPKDGIGDGPNDLIHGTMENPEDYECDMDSISDELEDDTIIIDLTEQVNKTLDMFKRFKNY